MSAEMEPAVHLLDADGARRLTDEIRTTAERSLGLLFQAHERRAWVPLGYASFADYTAAEFGMGKSNTYRSLTQSMVVYVLESATGVPRAGLAISARQAQVLEPELVNVVRAVKRAIREHPDEPPENLVAAVVKRMTRRPAKEPLALTSGSEAESSESDEEPAEPPAPQFGPIVAELSATVRGLVVALSATSAEELATVPRSELQAARKIIAEALLIQAQAHEALRPQRHPVIETVATSPACAHPRDKRHNLGYAIKCGACGDVVKR